MKVRDVRDGTVFRGELVAILSAHEEPSDADLKRYYKLSPGSSQYYLAKKPCTLPRMVLRRTDRDGDSDIDPSYYIIPRYEFYVEVQDNEVTT